MNDLTSSRTPFSAWALQLAIFHMRLCHPLRQRVGPLLAINPQQIPWVETSSPHPFLCGADMCPCSPPSPMLELGHTEFICMLSPSYCFAAAIIRHWPRTHESSASIHERTAWEPESQVNSQSPQCVATWLNLQTQMLTARKPSILQTHPREFSKGKHSVSELNNDKLKLWNLIVHTKILV